PREPSRDLQGHPPRESRARKQVVMIEMLREEEVGGAQHVRLHPERSVLALAAHPFLERHAAGEEARYAVDAEQALPAAAAEAEGTARAVVLDRPREGRHAFAQQRRGDGVAANAVQPFSVEREAERSGQGRT